MARKVEQITDKNARGFGRWKVEGVPGTYVELEAKTISRILDERDARLLSATDAPSPGPAKDA